MQDNNIQESTDILKKYLSAKEPDFRGTIFGIFKNKKIFNLVNGNDLYHLKKWVRELDQQNQKNNPSTSDEYDQIMNVEHICIDVSQFIMDLEKIYKILAKNKIKSDYFSLIEIATKIINQEIQRDQKKSVDKLTIPAYKLISKITKNKKEIIREYLKLGYGAPDEMIIKDLFNKFRLSSTKWEIKKLLMECLEDAELEDFEKNLGIKHKKKIGDFENLSGYQFEDYLKELFLILDYKVIRTKLSSDQGADLIINKDEQKTVVQAKKYSGNVTNKAIQEVVASKEHYNANKAMVVTTGHFTKSAIELAKSNNVELRDNNKLKKIISEINTSSKYITESAIELAESNNVELRDKVENVISEIDNLKNMIAQSGAEKVSFPTQHTILEEGSILTNCPLCSAEIKFALDDLPAMNSTVSLSCPKCNFDMMMKLREKDYSCNACKTFFNTIKERIEHQKSCKLYKARLFKCKYCKKEAKLDDAEFYELNEKGQVTTTCPSCKKSCTLKK